MFNYKDYQIITDENDLLNIAIISVKADREEQQDCYGWNLNKDEGVVVVCDGMGGCDDGKRASEVAVNSFLEQYQKGRDGEKKCNIFIDAVQRANQEICQLKNEKNERIKAGSTLVSVCVHNRMLDWCSVGDSRAYLLRNGEFVQLTQDHNYNTVLTEQLNAGLIDENKYNSEKVRGDSLISFLGIGRLRLIDYSAEPFALQKDDRVILMSDGLYKVVTDDEIKRILENFCNINEAVQAFEMKAQKNANVSGIKRDNMTAAIIKIK